MLSAYRVKQMVSLARNIGYICEVPYEVMLKTLSHIKIRHNNLILFVFLAGVIIEITANELKDIAKGALK